MPFKRGALIALLAALAAPAAAHASTSTLVGGTLTVTGTAATETIGVGGSGSIQVTSTSTIDDADGVGLNCSVDVSNTTLTCTGGVNNVVVNAGAGDDTINRVPGLNPSLTVNGEGGNDSITLPGGGSGNSVHADGGAGDDAITGRMSDVINGGDGNDSLFAGPDSSFDGSATGGPGNDTLTGNDRWSDSFYAEPGADTYNGGSTPAVSVNTPPGDEVSQGSCDYYSGCASDSMSYSGDTGVSVTLDGAANDGAPGEGDNVNADIERVSGSDGDDTLDASMSATEPKSLSGNAGNDTLTGGAKDDYLSGGPGNDVMNGGLGNDSFGGDESIDPDQPAKYQAGNDVFNGGPGDDWFYAGSTLDNTDPAKPTQDGSGLGADVFNGGDGEDEISISRTVFDKRTPDANDPSTVQNTYVPITISLDGVANDGYPGSSLTIGADIENAATGAGADTIIGNAGSNVLSGGSGNDTIDGGAGVDLIYGDNGVDTITSRDLGFDRVDCGLATDAPVQGDQGDLLMQCEQSNLTALPAPPDTTKATAKVKISTKIKSKALRKSRAISLVVTPSEPVLIEAALFPGAKANLVGQSLIGKARLGLKGGKRTVKIKLSNKTVKGLLRKARGKKGTPVTVVLTLTDAVGHVTKVTRTVRITK